MKNTSTLIAGLVAGIALALAAGSYAQSSGGMGPGFGPGMGMGMGPGYGPGMGAGPGSGPMAGVDPSVRVETRLGALKTQMKITAEQETAWQSYVGQVKQQAASMQAWRTQMHQSVTTTAPERMALHTAGMQQRLAAMTEMSKALDALYAVLTPEQKTIADQNLGMIGQRGGRFGRFGRCAN